MKTHNHLIVLANAAIAELYSYNRKNEKLELLDELTHPESTFLTREIISDQSGAYNHSGTYAPRTAPKEVEAEKFAASLAHTLDKMADKVSEITLIAPAHFHPLVKHKLKKITTEKITDCINKDYTKLGIKALEKQLTKLLALKF